LLGALVGAVIGYIFDSIAVKRVRQEKQQLGNAVVVVRCTEAQLDSVETILLGNGAKAVTELNRRGKRAGTVR